MTSRFDAPLRNSVAAAILIFAGLLYAAPALAQYTQQGSKLIGSGAQVTNADQGAAVAISADGNTLLEGGPADDAEVGAAWVFTRSNGVWSQQGSKLVGSGYVANPSGPQEGQTVALSGDGNTAAIGSENDNGYVGAVWIFTRSNGVWTQQGTKLVATDTVGASSQGTSLALSNDGNTLIVGGDGDNSYLGAAWVFVRNNGVWTEQQKLVGTGSVGSFVFQGQSVGLSADGNTAIVGGTGDNTDVGAAWIFTRNGTVWTQQGAKLVGTGYADFPHQGSSVALSSQGNTAIIGAYFDNNETGAAWIFTRSGATWTQQGSKLVGSGSVGFPNQGNSVALSGSGNIALVGGSGDNSNAGAVWVFTLSGGVWSQQGAKIIGTGAVGAAEQGQSVALTPDGTTAAEGGYADNANIGAVWVFTNPNAQGAVPMITSISPANGPALGGTGVSITGNNFLGATAVNFGSTSAASFVVNSATSITATSPPGARTVDVTVTTPGGTSATSTADQFAYEPSHDFNGDGKSDILWRDTAGNVGLWLMNGAAISQGTVFGNVPTIWSVVGQRDFNGDGNADILWRDTAGDIGLWLMNGTAVTQGTVFGNVSTVWSVSATGDFNGDGKADILWLDSKNDVGVWLMNGTIILQTAVIGQLPANWTIAGADMKGEVFQSNTVTGDVGIWLLNGTAVAQTVDLGAVPLTWTIAGLGDFDGNGSTDILWRDSSGNVGIWLMNGLQIMSTKVLGNVPLTWRIAQTGDYNGDGMSDILWTDSSGNVGVWFMNGTAISSTIIYGNVGTSWTVQSLNAD